MNKRGLESDEWVRRNGDAVRDFLQPKTVPLRFFGNDVRLDQAETGSGVLVALGSHHFILTAGHCVKGCAKAKAVVVPIVSRWKMEDARRLSPILQLAILASNSVTTSEGTVDFGYIQLYPDAANTMQASPYVFTNRLAVRHPSDASREDEWVVVTGYPKEIAQQTARTDVARFMMTLTLVARKEELPKDLPDIPGAPEGFHTLDLLDAKDAVESPDGKVFEPAETPSHEGASGGGCWMLDISSDATEWTSDEKPSLCAIHTGHTESAAGNQILREVPIGYHLRLLAEDYPDLAPALNQRWPELERFSTR